MKGYQLEFFVLEDRRHKHRPLWEWILEAARSHGIRGATAFTAAMGYGHHRRIHSAHFFELTEQPVEITMAVNEEEAERLFALLKEENIEVFYVKVPVEFGTSGREEE